MEVSDAAYMDAVAKGDMKTAQRMVDAAARKAGYLDASELSGPKYNEGDPVYHNTTSKFTAFEPGKNGLIQFTPSKTLFGKRGDIKVAAYLKEPVIRNSTGLILSVKDPSQVKLADPVTYDDNGNVIPLSQRFSSRSEDIRNPKRSDTSYMDAVAKGDMKTAQRMVDAAAKKSGYDLEVWHGTRKSFTSFKPDSWFATDKRDSTAFGSVKRYFLSARNVVDNTFGKTEMPVSTEKQFDASKGEADSVVHFSPKMHFAPVFQIYDPSIVKSADPVTYDDNGNVIPLSKRFSDQSEDIRNPKRKIKRGLRKNPVVFPADDITFAAASPTPANVAIAAGKTLWDTPAFKKWFGDSKVRDLANRPMVVYHGTCSAEFTEFDPTKTQEVGFHFGTPAQAKDFLKGCGTSRGKSAGIYPVYLSIQNPIFTPDVYSEDPVYLIQWLEKTNHIHEWFPDESDSYYRSMNRLRDQMASTKSDSTLTGAEQYKILKPLRKATSGLLRKVIMRKGYDGIRYKNENEGRTDDPTNIAWVAFSPGQIKSATENIRTFDRRDPDIRNPMKTNPMDPRSSMTQIEGTKKTYAKAAKMITGKAIDYGAGLGIGSDILRAEGLSVDSFEPYPEKWKGKRPPTYTDSAKIPSASYDSLVSFSVINVVEPDMRKFLFQEVDRILRPNGVALITGRSRSDVEKSTTKIPHIEDGGYLVDEGDEQRYQKGFTQAELERYAKEVLGPGFTVQKNGSLNGASIKITKGKTNPVTRSMIRTKLSRILEPGDRVLDYDRAQGEDLYRLWDMVHTDKPLTKEALVEIEGMLDDDGVLVIQSGEEPSGLQDHFRKATRYQGMLLVQGPMNPEEARINTEKLRRDLE